MKYYCYGVKQQTTNPFSPHSPSEAQQQAGQVACDFDLQCTSMWVSGLMWKVKGHSHDPVYGPSSDHTSAGNAYSEYPSRDVIDSNSFKQYIH